MRTFTLEPNRGPRAWGQAHGEAFAGLIREIAEIRIALTIEVGGFPSRASVERAARAHLPALAGWDHALYEELVGIAEGSGLEPEAIVVLNHYTDLRDLDPRSTGGEDCSTLCTCTRESRLVGQTWDMHGSAEPYVLMLGVPASGAEPAAWLLSLVGCLGMAGMNGRGVGLSINNLKSLDARVGVVWPALVRAALRMPTAEAARDVILGAPVGSGHHYLVADPRRAFGIETSGALRKLVFAGESPVYVHTNHCLDAEVATCTGVPPESTSHARYAALTAAVTAAAPTERAAVWALLGSHAGYPESVCTHLASPAKPHGTKTCAGLVMDLVARELWTTAGCVHHARPEVYDFREGP